MTLAVENKDIWLKEKGISEHYLKHNNSLHVTGVQQFCCARSTRNFRFLKYVSSIGLLW